MPSSVSLFLAQGAGPQPAVGSAGAVVGEFFIVLGAVLMVSIILALALTTSRSRRRLRRLHTHRTEAVFPESANAQHRRHRRRRRRHDDFPANPTLAETGGLPPIRTESESDLPAQHQPQ